MFPGFVDPCRSGVQPIWATRWMGERNVLPKNIERNKERPGKYKLKTETLHCSFLNIFKLLITINYAVLHGPC